MKKLKYISTLAILIGSCLISEAQNFSDALRYSRTQYLGTARFNAMGGSFGALGGDISSLAINPAGVGVYRNSEFTFSAGFNFNQAESSFRSEIRDDNDLNFNIGNLGFVANYKGDPNAWKNYSFAVSYNRMGTFHENIETQGTSLNDNSIIVDYVNILNDNNASVGDVEGYAYPFGPSHAFYTFMIDTFQLPNGAIEYFRLGPLTSGINQTESRSRSGSMNDLNISFGGNYQDRLFVGISGSIMSARYEESRTYREDYEYGFPLLPTDFFPRSYEERTNLIVNGSGINAKIGLIYRATQAIRIGASIHTPTVWGFREEYSFNANSSFVDGSVFDQEDETFSNWEYRVQSPWRYNGSIAYVHKNKAMFNIDYEYIDFSRMRLDDRNGFETSYSAQNQEIGLRLEATHNVRVGGEYRFEPFVVRAGYRMEESPFNGVFLFNNPDMARNTYSLGTGYRSGNYNLDVTYLNTRMNSAFPLYPEADAINNIENSNHQLIMTVGWRW